MKTKLFKAELHDIKNNPWFWLFLFIKISLFLTQPGQIAKGLFIPFLDNAVLDPLNNPWSFYPANYFPYGSVLFFIMFIPKIIFFWIFGDAALGNTFLSYTALRAPIFLADIIFLYLLLIFPNPKAKRWLFIYYWINPVLLYINYVHVQLDIFAVLFVFISFYYLRQKKEKLCSVFLAFAILCKFHVAILVPLFMAYFWRSQFKDKAWKTLISWSVILSGIVFVGFLPHLMSSHLGYISFQSPEAMKIFSLSLSLDGKNQIFIGFGVVVAVLVRLLLSSRMTEQGLIYACGLVLGLLLITTSAMPGWYYWIYPFLALFLSQYMVRLQSILAASYLFYLFHFIPIEYEWFTHPLFSTVSFTLLQMCLLGLLLAIWFYVIRFEMPWLRRSRPLLIGIAGDSGAGKNTLSKTFFDLFGHQATSLIEGDDYHRWERGNKKWHEYTHLNPRANSLETLSQHVSMLSQGQPIYKSHYDHTLGQFTDDRLIETKKNIIVQGLHAFYPLLLRKKMDIKIFTHPNEQLRLFWKLKRDYSERGHSIDAIVNSFKSRQYDSLLHILPQKNFADWVIEYIPTNSQFSVSLDNIHHLDFSKNPEIYQVHRIANDTPIDQLILELSHISTIQILCTNDFEDMDFLKIEVRGSITVQDVERIAEKVFGTLRHLTRSYYPPVWHENFEGINQLLFLAMMQRSEG